MNKFKESPGICFIGFLLLLPLIIFTLSIFGIYKAFVWIILKIKYGNDFRGYLEGSDVFWAIENNNSKSIINMLTKLEIQPQMSTDEICHDIKNILKYRILISAIKHPKLFFKKYEKYGYSYWIIDDEYDLDNYIKFIHVPKVFTNEIIGELSNIKLPYNHTAMWEIFIGKSTEEYCSELQILCRLHHALGDGIALMRLLMEDLADKNLNEENVILNNSEDESFKSSLMKLINMLRNCLESIIRSAFLLYNTPAHILQRMTLMEPDKNVLHKKNFSGEKILCSYTENDGILFNSLRSAKRLLKEARFSDVLLSTISCGIENFLIEKNMSIPDTITMILPARIQIEEKKLKLQNKFSVALQTIPIKTDTEHTSPKHRIALKLAKIKIVNDKLRTSPEYLINYGILNIMTNILPKEFLKPFITSTCSPIAVSNLPGPQNSAKILGHTIESIVFWIPNRGTMGIGFSMLSYRGNLQLGLISDKNVLNSQEDVDQLLVNVIKQMQYLKYN